MGDCCKRNFFYGSPFFKKCFRMEGIHLKTVLKYSITVVIGLLMVIGVCDVQNLFGILEPLRICKILCNAFFISGILLLGVGILVFISKEGMFDGMSYYAGRFMLLFSPKYDEKRKNMLSYYEYKKAKNRESGGSFILITGLGFLVVALVFLGLFYYYF